MKRTLLFAGALGLVLAACSGSTDDAQTGASEDDLTASKAACQGKSCGDTCSLCNGKPGCVETAVLKQCNAKGRCSSSAPQCALDGGPAPDAGPAPYNPCGGKACGDACTICPPGDPNCFETAVLKACSADGKCLAGVPTCGPLDGGPAPYDPCGGKKCGASCTICPPWDASCVETAVLKFCHSDGKCHDYAPACIPPPPYQPCAGKACGASCTICDPADPSCVETAVLKQCHADGSCSPSPAVCK